MNKRPDHRPEPVAGASRDDSSALPLAGCRVLLTRPTGRQRELREAVRAGGGEAISLPLLAIEPITASEAAAGARQEVARLREFDLLIFISANAVRFGVDWISGTGASIAANAAILAVGAATAREASRLLGRPADSPTAGGGSEHLLAMPQLKEPENARIAIFRGEGGRELLAEELRRRGARVTYFEVYRRARAPGAGKRLRQILTGGLPDYVVLTSAGALRYWRELLAGAARGPDSPRPAAGHLRGCPIAEPFALPLGMNEGAGFDTDQLLTMPVVAPSRRVAELAAQQGFGAVIDAGDAGAGAMVRALTAHFRRRG